MKEKRRLLLVPLCLVAWLFLCGAALPEETQEQLRQQLEIVEEEGVRDGLSKETRRLMDELGIDSIDPAVLIGLAPSDFFRLLWELLQDKLRTPLAVLLTVTGVAVFGSLLQSMQLAFGGYSLNTVFQTVSVVGIAGAVLRPVMDCVGETAVAIRDASLFLLSFVPVFSSVVMAGGQMVTATGYQTLLLAAAQFVARISTDTLVPLLGVYLALCLVGSISQVDISQVAGAVKKVVTWSLTLIMTLFVGLLSIQTMVASRTDGVTTKTARFLVGSFVPVVGGALADALATAQSCMHLVKAAVGGYGILAAALTFLPVLLSCAGWRLAMGVSAGVCGMLDQKPLSKVLEACGTVLSILLSITLCFALLIIISTTVILVVGTGG